VFIIEYREQEHDGSMGILNPPADILGLEIVLCHGRYDDHSLILELDITLIVVCFCDRSEGLCRAACEDRARKSAEGVTVLDLEIQFIALVIYAPIPVFISHE
jgi:hypothetical protein